MEMLKKLKHRRSIRRYTDQRVEKEKLLMIQEAGIYAPNPGGRQGTKIIMLDDPKLINEIGIINANCENRNWGGHGVSSDQPSIIDDLSIKSGFYGCPALGMVCVQRERATQVNFIGSAFVCAENMVIEAYELGVSSCIVGRAAAGQGGTGQGIHAAGVRMPRLHQRRLPEGKAPHRGPRDLHRRRIILYRPNGLPGLPAVHKICS